MITNLSNKNQTFDLVKQIHKKDILQDGKDRQKEIRQLYSYQLAGLLESIELFQSQPRQAQKCSGTEWQDQTVGELYLWNACCQHLFQTLAISQTVYHFHLPLYMDYKPLVIIPLVNLFVKNPYIKWGLCSAQFAKKLIEPNFSFYSWICTNEMPWDLIDNTNYQTHSVIILIKCYNSALSVLHYMTIIGKSNDGKQYLLFDNSEKIYLASSTQLQRAMKIDTPTVNNYNAYRVG